ncbi:MAG: alpha-E domain-containing protein [Pseudomonadota bacterium]
MLSRVAERLYWMARYIERTENTARLMLVQHHLVLDLPAHIRPGWDLAIGVLGTSAEFAALPGKPTEKNIIGFLFGSRDNPSSILSSLAGARENIRTTREVLPTEAWERINSLYLSVAQRGPRGLPGSIRHKVLNDIVQRCQQITGMLAGSMNNDAAYQFIRIGRNLERADMSTRIIDTASARLMGEREEILPYRNVLWVSVLKSLSAYQMYRLSVRRNVNPEDVLHFLLESKVFPRALAHTLDEIDTSIGLLPRNQEALAAIAAVKRAMKKSDTGELRNAALHAFIDDLQLMLEGIHTAIKRTWFDPATGK